MKILLIGEYSGLHLTLAKGLRKLGHKVTIASDGDTWKAYSRDIDLKHSEKNRNLNFVFKLFKNLHRLVGYDIVQLINPIFLDIKAENNKRIFNFLVRFNNAVFLGANGTDYYYVNHGLNGGLPKSFLNNEKLKSADHVKKYINNHLRANYIDLNKHIAHTVKGITACCTEYKISYDKHFKEKTTFIPLPINTEEHPYCSTIGKTNDKLSFFLGHYSQRGIIKGTDVLKNILLELKEQHPDEVDINIVESVPYATYQKLLNSSHVLCEQLYSYGCGMNGVLGLSKGLIVAGGGHQKMLDCFGEDQNRAIIDLPSDKEEVLHIFKSLVANRNTLYDQAQKSRAFAEKHHDFIKVAKEYLAFWESKL